MSNQQGQLAQVFDLPQIEAPKPMDVEVTIVESKDITILGNKELSPRIEDSDYIRTELKELVQTTKDALDLAIATQVNDSDPKAAEAVAKLATTLATSLKTLIELNSKESDKEIKIRELENRQQGETKPPVQNIQNNLIVSTVDLIEMILNKKKELT